jgi:putative ABC transport system permease protein
MVVHKTYFSTMGIPLVRGRLPDERDLNGPPVALVSLAWANRYSPDSEVIGQRMYEGGCRSCDPTSVIGVVGDASYQGLDSPDLTAIYRPYAQISTGSLALIVRTHSGTLQVALLRDAIRALDPGLALANARTMKERLSDSITRPRYWATLVVAFALVGVALAGIGVYGVLSHFVNRQAKEIGIRIALGADPRSVRNMVVVRGMKQALSGLAIGLIAALLLGKTIQGLLFGVAPNDPLTLTVVSLSLAVVAVAACYLPARRATRVDPVTVLADQ